MKVKLKKGFRVPGKVCNQNLNWKIDTGARRTFITSKLYRSIQHRSRPGLKPTRAEFHTANGNKVVCEGEALVLLCFAGTEIYFPVIVGGVMENLLGEDFLQQFQCNFDHKNAKFLINLECNTVSKREQQLHQVVSREAVEVPAGCEVIVNAKVKGVGVEKQGILVPDVKFVEKHSLLVARVLTNSEHPNYARILNPGNCYVEVQKGSVIALFEPVREIYEPELEDKQHVFRVSEHNSDSLPDLLSKTFQDGIQNLDSDQADGFHKLLCNWQNVFAKPGEVGLTDVGTHKIT